LIAYLDCVGGLAGDMLIAALLDAGAPEAALREVPGRLGLERVELKVTRTERHGIGALHLEVCNPDGDHAHPHRSWRSIREQLESAELDEPVRARALAVFERLAEVEGGIHGVPPDEIHFHELGSVDTLVDVVGATTLLAELGVTRLECSPLPMGRGVVRAAHGVLPLPAPATLGLLQGVAITGVDVAAELVTPTGAALASTLADAWGEIPRMTLRQVGYGAGTADFSERANLVRVLLGDAWEPFAHAGPDVVLLETNLDDLIGELVPDAAESCFEAGALDVWTTPVTMKKGRPGLVLSALARPDTGPAVARAILQHTSALGVRVAPLRRYELDRERRTVEVDGHPVRVKVGLLEGAIVNLAPEHDDCAAVARVTGSPVKSVWTAALAAARELR
jgi:pyridinium-3,5-bisthiocarboxylic acid mononucleotide nickel chelatase